VPGPGKKRDALVRRHKSRSPAKESEALAAFVARIERAALLSVENLPDSIRQYRQLLLANPPQELLPALYCGLGNAHYRNGDMVDALVYWELYRPSCPESEAPALEAILSSLRESLP
jgi:outer membrane protein assembly factor BamD (BamD/ComL family)